VRIIALRGLLASVALISMADILRPVDHGSVDDWLRPWCHDQELAHESSMDFAAKVQLCRILLPKSARWGDG
jgi:hypothetical protein